MLATSSTAAAAAPRPVANNAAFLPPSSPRQSDPHRSTLASSPSTPTITSTTNTLAMSAASSDPGGGGRNKRRVTKREWSGAVAGADGWRFAARGAPDLQVGMGKSGSDALVGAGQGIVRRGVLTCGLFISFSPFSHVTYTECLFRCFAPGGAPRREGAGVDGRGRGHLDPDRGGGFSVDSTCMHGLWMVCLPSTRADRCQ